MVGSRLLFRGYGISSAMAPVHAGLIGMDSLILLDEAHLAAPFADVVAAVGKLQSEGWCREPLPSPAAVRLVRLTASAATDADPLIGPADRAHRVLGPRLAAAKPAQLTEALEAELPATVAARALALVEGTPAGMPVVRRVGAVLNTVAAARAVHRAVAAAGVATVLLTGRMRPHDRDHVWEEWKGRLLADPKRDRAAEAPCVVVATQAVEVGVDLDLDALVSEAAPLAALAQRVGRVDRLGVRGRSPLVLVCPAERLRGKPKPDPVYGEATAATWKWLAERAAAPPAGKRGKPAGEPVIDLGWETLGAVDAGTWVDLAPPDPMCEPLDAVMAGLFAQTLPRPEPDPDPALFLHGRGGEGEVQVVWRADLSAGDLTDRERALATVAACPPVRGEALALPLSAARRWLAGLEPAPLADVPAGAVEERATGGRPALAWDGPDDSDIVGPRGLEAGMTLVVPASYGGIDPDSLTWDPASTAPVPDVAEAARRAAGHRAVLRLHPMLTGGPDGRGVVATLARAVEDEGTGEVADDAADRLRDAVDRLIGQERLPADHPWLRTLKDVSPAWRLSFYDPDHGHYGLRLTAPGPESPEPTTADDTSLEGEPMDLVAHCAGVSATAAGLAAASGLSGAPAEAVRLGALLHDAGKAEPRFQAWLRGGDRLATVGVEPIAKGIGAPTPAERAAARHRAGLPQGVRHEMWSLALAERVALPDDIRDLTLWLVATHHGRGRPLPPVPPDDAPSAMRLDWPGGTTLEAPPSDGRAAIGAGWPGLFARLNARFGPWGLAWLEALVRLSDHRRSAAERQGVVDDDAKPSLAAAAPLPPPPRHSLPLEGLHADTLLGFLAGLGTLRLLTRAWTGDDVRLAWSAVFPHTVTLSATRPLDAEGVLDALEAALAEDFLVFPDFGGRGDVGFDPSELRDRLAAAPDADAAARLRAFATPTGVLRSNAEAVEVTPFVMLGAGQTNFLKAARALAADVGRAHLERTLFRAWDYADAGLDSLRWDPEDAREHAYALHDPGSPAAWKGNEPRRMAGANRLALAALPCLPVVPCAGGPRAAGTARVGGSRAFVWPVWAEPTDLATAQALLTAPEVLGRRGNRARSGLAAVLYSPRFSAGRYPSVLPARPLPSTLE